MSSNNNQNKSATSYLAIISYILLIFSVSLTLYGFFSNFGITDDEGFYLYLLIHGISETSFTLFHTGIHFIGTLFNHNLLGYRILNLLLILTSLNIAAYNSFLFYFRKNDSSFNSNSNLKLFLVFTNISSLAFFSFIPTFSYTSAAIISTNLWIGSLLFYFNNLNRKEVSAITLIIIALYFALISRIQFFLPLLFLTPIAIYIISKRSGYQSGTTIKRLSLSLFFLGLVFLLSHKEFIYSILPIVEILYSGSHKGLFTLYVNQIIEFSTNKDFAIFYYTICLLLLYILAKILSKRLPMLQSINIKHIILIIGLLILKDSFKFFLKLFDINGTPSDASHRIGRYIFAIMLLSPIILSSFSLINKKLFDVKEKLIKNDFYLLYLLCVIPSLLSGFGTGSNIVLWWSFALGSISIPFAVLLIITTHGFKKNSIYFLFSILILSLSINEIVYREQIYQFRRNTLHTEQIEYSKKSPHLKLVKLDTNSSLVIDNLIFNLEKNGFSYKEDRIFAYPNLPGLISSTKAKAFGEAWNQETSEQFRELKNIENKICAYIKLEERVEKRKIYLLLHGELPNYINQCLKAKIVSTKYTNEISLGEIKQIPMVYNNFKEKIYKIKLIGPFQLK